MMRHSSRHIRTVGITLVATAGLFMSACNGLLSDPAPPPARFDLGSRDVELSGSGVPVALAGVEAPAWLDTSDIRYRPVHRHPGALESYARHAWAAPAPVLVEERVRARLVGEGRRTTGPSDARLALRLTRFEQVFETREQAYVRAELVATLHPADSRERTTRRFRVRRESTPNAEGATRELAKATTELVDELMEWLEKERSGR